jgi:exosortase/archaeosortase family protein
MKRTVFSLASVFAVLYAAATLDVFSEVTRSLSVLLLRFCGLSASVQNGHLAVGDMLVPWARDCAGLNTLALIWAVTLWSSRAEPLSRRFWIRMGLAIPVTLVSNAARILTLIAYRSIVHPAVETPELHYFIGFFWLIPFLRFFAPRQGRPFGPYAVETLWIASLLSMTAPLIASPGGGLAATCVVVCLARNGIQSSITALNPRFVATWAAGGVSIAVLRVESLWIPWLLACPVNGSSGSEKRGLAWWLLPGTLPVVAMQPLAQVLLWPAAALEALRLLKDRGPAFPPAVPPVSTSFRSSWAPAFLSACLFFPFATSTFPILKETSSSPPEGVMARAISDNGHEIRLLGQSPDIDLVWYGPRRSGRHHTLSVCMKFRGVSLRTVPGTPGVLTDGKRWMREFFFLPGSPALDYGSYLLNTFIPGPSTGSHVIASAPIATMSSSYFAGTVEDTAARLHRLQLPGEYSADRSLANANTAQAQTFIIPGMAITARGKKGN